MRIKKLQLKNGYKRFQNLIVDLGESPKRIIALVGPNGCGKSSVFDGMLFHADAYGYSLGNKGSKDYRYHSMNKIPNYTYQNIEIDFVNGNYDKLAREMQKLGKERTIFSFRSPYRYNSNLKV